MVHWWWTMLTKGYEAACRDWAAFAEKVCEGLSDERLAAAARSSMPARSTS